MPTRVIPIASIEVPKKWRTVRKKTVAELVLSFRKDNLLQPIGLRPGLKPGTFILVYGRHRLEAAKKCGWGEIEAKVLEIGEKDAESATNAENLFRNPLTAAEKVVALKSWSESYMAQHPEVHGRGKAGGTANAARIAAEKAEAAGEAATELPKTFVEHVEEQTGIPKATVHTYLGSARNLSEEQIGVLAERDAPLKAIKTINKLPAEKRDKAIALVASGLGANEAIAQATLPDNASVEMVGDPAESPRAEADMSPDEWLETYCGEVLARLKYQVEYRKDALLYRKIRDKVHAFKTGTKNALAQSKAQVVGAYYLLVARFVNTDHPSRWQPCGPCQGTGQSGDKSKCGFCRGHAYTINK